jgi:hypothetical protein
MTKQVNAVGSTDVGELTDDAHCYGWEQMTVDGHPVCFNQRDSRAPMDDGDSLEYHVNIGVEKRRGAADHQPDRPPGEGMELRSGYGTPRPLVVGRLRESREDVHAAVRADRHAELAAAVLLLEHRAAGRPAAVGVLEGRKPAKTPRCGIPAMQWTGATNAGNFTFDRSYRISFEVAPNAEWPGCKSAAVWGWEPVGPTVPNYVSLEATTTSDQSGNDGGECAGPDRSISRRFTKAPKNGNRDPPTRRRRSRWTSTSTSASRSTT